MDDEVPIGGAPQEQQFVQALINAINNANVSIQQLIANMPPPPAAPVAAAAPPFLRTPLGAGITAVINYTEKDKQKLYKEATKSLFDTESKFGVEPGDFQTFINLLHVRARDLGMLDLGHNMMIPP